MHIVVVTHKATTAMCQALLKEGNALRYEKSTKYRRDGSVGTDKVCGVWRSWRWSLSNLYIKENMNHTPIFRYGLYTTPVAQLKAKHKEEWISRVASPLMGIGMTLPTIAVSAFV